MNTKCCIHGVGQPDKPEQWRSTLGAGNQLPVAPQTYTFVTSTVGGRRKFSLQNATQISPSSSFQPLHANAPLRGAGIGSQGLALNHTPNYNSFCNRLNLFLNSSYLRSTETVKTHSLVRALRVFAAAYCTVYVPHSNVDCGSP